MASPVDSARQGTNISTAATSHAINVGSPVAGTLLIVMVRFAGAPGTVTFTGYTQFAADTSDASDDDTRLYYRQADGSEGATDTLSTTNSIKLAAICWEVTGAENPATTAPSVSDVVIGTAANVNPGVVPASGPDTTAAADAGTINIGTVSTERIGQSFVAPTAEVSSVSVKLTKINSPTDDVIIEIQSDSGGNPSGTVIGTVATLSAASISTTATVYPNSCSIAVVASTTYWIVARRSGSFDSTNRIAWSQVLDSTYAGGTAKYLSSSSWFTTSGDVSFAIATGTLASKDYLFLTVIGLDSETATATQPAGYGNLASANSGTGGAVATNCMIWGASKAATAASEDPGAWTSSAPNAGVSAWTIAIPAPAAAAAPGPTAAFLKPPLRRRASRYLTFR